MNMNRHANIIIAGAGGIAEAVGLILAERSKVPPTLFMGNRTVSKAQDVAEWIERGNRKGQVGQGIQHVENRSGRIGAPLSLWPIGSIQSAIAVGRPP